MKLVNVTEHPLRFRDRSNHDWILEPSGIVVRAETHDRAIRTIDQPNGKTITLVRTLYRADKESLAKLETLVAQLQDRKHDYLLIGSTLAAMAYPWQVVAAIPISGLEKVPPRQKVMRDDKFVVYPSF